MDEEDKQSYLKKKQLITHNNPSPPTTTTTPSSPTHDFSFTISLRPPTNSTTTTTTTTTNYNNPNDTATSTHAIDLSPADDIFFHGHLLPLHLLPISPRSSTNSMDSFTLPTNLLLYDPTNPIGNTSFHCHHQTTFSEFDHQPPEDDDVTTTTTQNPPKSKSFSIFNIPKWKKRCDIDERERYEDQKRNNNKKVKLDNLGQLIKRYMKMVRPYFSSFQKSRRSNNRQSYSFSGNCSTKPPEMNKRIRGRFSAPASMRTSPANSGIIVASGTVSPSTTSESTMEELHAAIQAAIAHCKNSIAMEDKIQSQT